MSVSRRLRKDGSAIWYYDFVVNGKRYSGPGGSTKTQALRIQEKVRDEVISGRYELSAKIPEQSFEQFVQIYLERRTHLRSAGRDALSARNLLRFFKRKSFTSVSPADIENFKLSRRKDGVSNGTINRELACLKTMYNKAIRWGQARTNPVLQVDFLEEPPGRTRCLTITPRSKEP